MHQDLNPWFPPQGCYEKVKLWFDDNKHVLGTVGMCILIMQVREHKGPRPEQDESQAGVTWCLHGLVCEVCSIQALRGSPCHAAELSEVTGSEQGGTQA